MISSTPTPSKPFSRNSRAAASTIRSRFSAAFSRLTRIRSAFPIAPLDRIYDERHVTLGPSSMHRSSQPRGSVAEAQSRRSSDVVVHEKAVRQSAIEFRVHAAEVNIPLRCKLPVDDAGDRVQRTGALRVLFAVAELYPAGGRAEVGMLGVM